MSENEKGARVYKLLATCTKGAVMHGFMYGAVGFLFLPAGAPIILFASASAINGCMKEVSKISCQSDRCRLSVDIGFGSLGYVLRAAALATAGPPLVLGTLVERVVVGGLNGGLYSVLPAFLEGGNQQTLTLYNSWAKVEVGLSNVVTPLAAEGLDGFLSDGFKLIIQGTPPNYAASISTGIKVGSIVFASLTMASLTEKLLQPLVYSDEPAVIQDASGMNASPDRLVEEISVSGDVAVVKDNEEL